MTKSTEELIIPKIKEFLSDRENISDLRLSKERTKHGAVMYVAESKSIKTTAVFLYPIGGKEIIFSFSQDSQGGSYDAKGHFSELNALVQEVFKGMFYEY